MPKRDEQQTAPSASTGTRPARAPRASQESVVDTDANTKHPAGELAPKPDEVAGTPNVGTVKKLPLTEKVKKYLAKISPDIEANVYEIIERVVTDTEGNKNNVCFITFTEPSAEDVDDVYNEYAIKEILFAYHTIPEKEISGKAMVLEIIAPEDGADEPFVLCMQEV